MESTTMREAFEEIERLSQNLETRRLADFQEQELMDIMQREEDAREQVKKEVVIRLYTNGIPTEEIVKYIGLPFEKVREIIRSTQK